MKKLTQEFAYVTYAKNGDPTECFDNPVYAFQPPPIKIAPPSCSSSFSLSKLQSFKNNLSFCKSSLDKQARFTDEPSIPDLEACSNQITLNSKSNYNPNIYVDPHDIKYLADKKEPIYDEIKGKDSEDEELPDDHYDRPRPINKIDNYEAVDDALKRS